MSLLMQLDYLQFPNGRKMHKDFGFNPHKQLKIPHSCAATLPTEYFLCLMVKSANSFFMNCSSSLGFCSLLFLPNTSQPLSLNLRFHPKPAQTHWSQCSPSQYWQFYSSGYSVHPSNFFFSLLSSNPSANLTGSPFKICTSPNLPRHFHRVKPPCSLTRLL